MAFATDGTIGADLGGAASTDAAFKVGTTVSGTDGSEHQYVYAASAIARYDCVHVAASGTAASITAALAATAGQIGVAQVAMTTATYAWVQMSGAGMRLNVAASCASGVPLYTTDTPGTLDDATASASHHQVMGLMIVATNSGSASNVAAIASSRPIIRRPAA